jgi:hypothetical protein
MSTLPFTYDEVLAEIQRLSVRDDEGFTVQELSRNMGHSLRWCRDHIRQLMEVGKVKYNGSATRYRIDGRAFDAPVYLYVRQEGQGEEGKAWDTVV